MGDREELDALRRMAELEAKASGRPVDSAGFETFTVPARSVQFNQNMTEPARMTNAPRGTRQVPVESPMQRLLYEAGGRVTDALAERGAPPEVAAGAGYIANLAGQVGSSFIGGGVGRGAGEVATATGRRLMQSAIKPTIGDLQTGKAQRAIDFMLREGVNPTEGGVAALRAEGGELANQVRNVLANRQAMVPTANAENALLRLAGELESGTLGVQRRNEVMGVLRSFLDHPSVGRNPNMTVQDAQRMKQANYRELDDAAYGIGVRPAAEAQSVKDVTRALRTDIETAAPEVAGLNARGSEIWNAINVAERRALMEGNKNPINLPASFAMATHNPGLTLGMWLNSSAWGKSMLARGVYTAGELGTPIGAFAGAAAGSRSGSAEK